MRREATTLLLAMLLAAGGQARPEGRRRLAEGRLAAVLRALPEEDLAEVERLTSEDWEAMQGDAPFINETARSIKDSWDPVSGRDKEQRIKLIREQVLRFLGRKDNKNVTQPNEQQARIMQLISNFKIDRPWPSAEVYTELQSFYPSCDLPRNTDEEAWDKGLQMNLFFTLNFTSPNQGSTSIQYAKLRLYKLPQGNTTMALTEDCAPGQNVGDIPEKRRYMHFPATSSGLPIEDKQIRVSVYWYTRGLRKHRVKRKLLDSQMISIYGESWTEYNVKPAVKAWKELGKNFGISVEVEDEDRVILQASKIFVMMNCSKDASIVQPIPSVAVEGLDNNTREVLRPLSPLYPVLELSTREFPDSDLGYPSGGVRIPDHRLRHHHQPTDIPPINDTLVGGFRWEDPRHYQQAQDRYSASGVPWIRIRTNTFNSSHRTRSKVIKGLASEDQLENKIALAKAEEILGEDKDVNERQVYVTNNRTVINHSALERPPPDPSTMSQEAFMRSVEIDAKRRSEQRKEDKEIADRHLKIGNDAFRQQNYDKALLNYNKGIDIVRDSCLLYTNRALTYHRLGLNQRSLEDANKALWLYPKSLKGSIYKAQALHCLGQYDESIEVLKEACETHPNKKSFIEGIQKEWTQGTAYNQDATPK